MTSDVHTSKGAVRVRISDGYEHREAIKAIGGVFVDLGPYEGKVWEILLPLDRQRLQDTAYLRDWATKVRATVDTLREMGSEIIMRSDVGDILRNIDAIEE